MTKNSDSERLERAVRDACPSGLWSKGVKLARDDKVTLESKEKFEVVLRVAAPVRGVAPTVVLYPGERDWECDCDTRFDACEHVAAAVITFVRAETSGEAVAAADPKAAGTIWYRLERRRGLLALERQVAQADGQMTRLVRSVGAHVAGLAKGLVIAPDRVDLEVDGILGPHPAPVLTEVTGRKLCAALVGCTRLTLDGNPTRTSEEVVQPIAKVTRTTGGVLLSVNRAAVVDEVVGPGVGLCGETLRPLAATMISGASLEHLPMSRKFTDGNYGELVGTILPALRREVEIAIEPGVLLPGLEKGEPPRIDLGLKQNAGSVEVLPRLLYGNPERARIDGDKLVHLRGDVPVRDRVAEHRLVERLRGDLNLVCNRSVGFRGDDAVQFLRRFRESSFAENAEQIAAAVQLEAQIVVVGSRVEVHFVANGESADWGAGGARPRAQATDVMGAWGADNLLVPLSGGGFGKIPRDWIEARADLIADLLADDGSAGRALRTFSAARTLADQGGVPLPNRFAKLLPLANDFSSLPKAQITDDFSGELRDYQRVGVDWLRFLGRAKIGALLADDMGLGKTVQVLASVVGRTLIVAPTSTLPNWARESERFRPGLSVCLYHGSSRVLDPDADIVLTSYALLRRDIDELMSVEWDMAVLDEAQAIKNPDSQAAHAARRIVADRRVALSGTPVENRLEELWSISEFINPGLLGTRSEFSETFSKPIASGDARALTRLRTTLRPVVLRRRKSEVAKELPPRTEVILACELSDAERELYDAVRAASQANVKKALADGSSPMAALTALLRLRQVSCHSGLLPNRSAPTSSKVGLLVERLVTATLGDHKSLVFSQWTSLLDLVEPLLADAGLDFVRLDGSTRDRQKVVDEFQDDKGPPVMLISLKAGGTGLNLTAADYVFLLDPWWNPAVEQQAADRAHRIGQDKPVVVHRMIAANTVEEKMLALQASKLALAESAIGGVGAGARLSKDDLLALLES